MNDLNMKYVIKVPEPLTAEDVKVHMPKVPYNKTTHTLHPTNIDDYISYSVIVEVVARGIDVFRYVYNLLNKEEENNESRN